MNSKRKTLLRNIVTFFCLFIFAVTSILPVYADSQSYTYSADPSDSAKTWVKTSDDTWTMDIDGNGTTDVTLKSSKNDVGDEVWTYTFNVEDNEQEYYVYEQMLNNKSKLPTSLQEGYTSKGSDSTEEKPVQAVEADPGKVDKTTHSYTIINSKDHTSKTQETYGSLKITKTVTGTQVNENQKFAFTIQLSGSDAAMKEKIKGSQIFGDTPFMDGKAVINLQGGESKTITDIPSGLSYKVTETAVDGYEQTSKTGDTGSIAADTESDCVFTNNSTYTPPDPEKPQKTVSFTVVKQVTGASADPDAEYNFHVLLSGLTPDKSYSYGESGTYTADENGAADVAFSLKKDDSVKFLDIPENATYQVMEEAGAYTSSYSITDAKNLGEIAQRKGENTEENVSLATAKETADDGEDITVTFTNAFSSVQNLTIQKYLSETKDGKTNQYTDPTKEFEFTVDFTGLPENTSFDSDVGKVTSDEYGEASKTFTMNAAGADGKITFYNIPSGIQYKVTESGCSYKPSYSITTTDSKGKNVPGTVVKKNDTGSASTSLSTAQETVEENESDTVTFTNEEVKGINFGIHKVDGNNNVLSLKDATYEVFLYSDGKLVSKGTQTTDKDGFAGWKELTPGMYLLRENTAPDGYQKNEDLIFVIKSDMTIKYVSSVDTTKDLEKYASDSSLVDKMQTWMKEKTEEKDDVSFDLYKVEEQKIITLPVTGRKGIYMGLAAAAVLIAGSSVILLKRRRCRNYESHSDDHKSA